MSKRDSVKTTLYLFSFLVYIHIGFSIFKIITTTAPDFKDYFISAQELVKIAFNYSDNPTYSKYPLIPAMFFVPFTMLPYQIAQGTFVLLSVFCVFAVVYLSLKIIKKKIPLCIFLSIVSLAFLSFPTKFTLGMGQINLTALTFLLFSYYKYLHKKNIWSGIMFRFAIWTKPILPILGLFYILKKAWKIVFISAFLISLLSVISLILFGIDNNVSSFLTTLSISGPEGKEVYYNQGIMGFVSRITDDLVVRKLTFIVFAVMFLLFGVYKKSFSLFLITLLLINPRSWQHHFVFLIYPFIETGNAVLKKNKKIIASFLVFSYLLVSFNTKNPEQFQFFPQVLLLSHIFYGTVLLFLTGAYLSRVMK